MNNTKGFVLIAVVIIVLAGAGYMAMNPQLLQTGTSQKAPEKEVATKPSIAWNFESAGEVDAIPYTKVTVDVNGTAHDMGKFTGSCSEIGASGGIDGKGLLAGELSAAQCYFAGGGNEIGVFANEDGGYDIMVGEISEGDSTTPMFRGDFKIKTSIKI